MNRYVSKENTSKGNNSRSPSKKKLHDSPETKKGSISPDLRTSIKVNKGNFVNQEGKKVRP